MKIDKADATFSQYIRLRDMKCMRCHSPVRLNSRGLPVSHHASHFWGRGRESTRFDPENVTTHCHGCHARLTANPDEHTEWKKRQMTSRAYDLLKLRANTPTKKDRAMAYLAAKELLRKQLDKA